MSDTAGNYAMMISGSNVVQNVAKAESGTTIPGFTLIAIGDGISCNPGSYYNVSDSKFYQDSAFTTLTGVGTDDSADLTDTASTTYTGVSDLAAVMQDSSAASEADSAATS